MQFYHRLYNRYKKDNHMFDFIIGIVVGAVLILLVQWIIVIALQRHANMQVKELEQLLKQHENSQNIRARVEHVNGCFYIYDSKTDEFLVQGNSVGEMDAILKQRWPEKTIQIAEGVGNAVQQLKETR